MADPDRPADRPMRYLARRFDPPPDSSRTARPALTPFSLLRAQKHEPPGGTPSRPSAGRRTGRPAAWGRKAQAGRPDGGGSLPSDWPQGGTGAPAAMGAPTNASKSNAASGGAS